MNLRQKLSLVMKAVSNIHLFVLDFMGLLPHDIIYKIHGRNLKMIARGGTTDKDEIAVVMSGYEYDLTKLMKVKNALIVDLGAHIGSFTLYAYDYYKRDGVKIYSLEPSRSNYSYFVRNMQLNKLPEDSIMTFNLAVGGVTGKALLDVSKSNDSYFIATNIKNECEECGITTLSEFVHENNIEHIDILKVDIEGSEYEMLKDDESFQFIKKNVSYILIEIHDIDACCNKEYVVERLSPYFQIIGTRRDVVYFAKI